VLDQRGRTLFDALWAFFPEHEYCGELDIGVEGDRVWMTLWHFPSPRQSR
jgi:hypothetical protein